MIFSARAAKRGSKPSKARAMERAGAEAGKLHTKPYHSQSAAGSSVAAQEIRYKASMKTEEVQKRIWEKV